MFFTEKIPADPNTDGTQLTEVGQNIGREGNKRISPGKPNSNALLHLIYLIIDLLIDFYVED